MSFRSFIFSGVDFFLPKHCQACNVKLHLEDVLLCKDCFSKIETVNSEYTEEQYERHFSNNKYITAFCAAFKFEKDSPLQKLLHNLKYSNNFRNGVNLGQLITKTNKSIIAGWKVDLIIPVPLHSVKKAERGYNQSAYICQGVSKSLNISPAIHALKRKKLTSTQTKLGIGERKENVSDAFEVKNKKIINGRTILLIDDVITTGSTINECARVLLESGANKIYAASAAVA